MNLTSADRAAWTDYLACNKAARESYNAMPTSFHRAGPANACDTCGKPTKARGRVCRACRAAERGEPC